jgi:hypothetical protein
MKERKKERKKEREKQTNKTNKQTNKTFSSERKEKFIFSNFCFSHFLTRS